MKLNDYLDLYEVLQQDRSTRNERRAFGLEHQDIKDEPLRQLKTWVSQRREKFKQPRFSETFNAYLYAVTLSLVIIALALGLFSGIGLLSYNGKEPVNIIYFMAMVVFVPLLTMTLTLFSMLRANRQQSMLVHLSPAFWMEKILALFPSKIKERLSNDLSELKVTPLVANWLVIKRSQLIALSFSFGLLLALLSVVATHDIAFAWSTTLRISPENFHHFLETLSFAWKDLFPWAVPSVELVEQSQYYRLGGELGDEMIKRASLLGEWWKFLVFATLFYAIILRFLMLLLATFGLHKAIGKSFMGLDGVKQLLNDFNEPVITTSAKESESGFIAKDLAYMQVVHTLEASYDGVLGWAIDEVRLKVINDSMTVETALLFEVGGANSLQEDSEVISQCHGEVLLFVKAWEPPTMDFIDFLEMLLERVDSVVVAPLGTTEQKYVTKASDLDVWARKIVILNSEHVWLKV